MSKIWKLTAIGGSQFYAMYVHMIIIAYVIGRKIKTTYDNSKMFSQVFAKISLKNSEFI